MSVWGLVAGDPQPGTITSLPKVTSVKPERVRQAAQKWTAGGTLRTQIFYKTFKWKIDLTNLTASELSALQNTLDSSSSKWFKDDAGAIHQVEFLTGLSVTKKPVAWGGSGATTFNNDVTFELGQVSPA